MSKHRTLVGGSSRGTGCPRGISVAPLVTTGMAIAGAGFWLATSDAGTAEHSVATVQLASVESSLPLTPPVGTTCSDPLLCSGLFGPAASSPTPNTLATALAEPTELAAPTVLATSAATDPDPISALIGIFIGNGADAPADCTGDACNGRNGGLLFGSGGNGANGGGGGNAGLWGHGGDGDDSYIAGLAGGRGGNGGALFGNGGAGGAGGIGADGGDGGNGAMLVGNGGHGGLGGDGVRGTDGVNGTAGQDGPGR